MLRWSENPLSSAAREMRIKMQVEQSDSLSRESRRRRAKPTPHLYSYANLDLHDTAQGNILLFRGCRILNRDLSYVLFMCQLCLWGFSWNSCGEIKVQLRQSLTCRKWAVNLDWSSENLMRNVEIILRKLTFNSRLWEIDKNEHSLRCCWLNYYTRKWQPENRVVQGWYNYEGQNQETS